MKVIPGRPELNIQTMLSMIESARSEQVDLIVFPELCVSGYILTDMWVNESFCDELMQYNDVLLRASTGIAIAYGNLYMDRNINTRWNDTAFHPNKDGRTRKYNAVHVVQDGKYVSRRRESNILPPGVQPKTLMPEYRIFDDERYYFSLQDVVKDAGSTLEDLLQPFQIETQSGTVPVGFQICEDLWCQEYRSDGRPINPTNMLIANGAEVIVNISASPWNQGKNASRDKRILFLKQEAGNSFVPFLYVNKTGVQNNGKNFITFDGGTTVYNSDGKPVLFAKAAYEQELIVFENSLFSTKALERKEAPPIQQKFDAIINGIRHLELFKQKNKALQFVIGLSGGIDSAVVASLLVVACGKENVLAVNMPSRYNLEKTKKSAAEVASNLGIEFRIVPVDELADLNRKIFPELDEAYDPPLWARELSDENIQAKIRGTAILSNIAGRYGRFMTNNGNKLETALGYTTLYGDVNGAIAPIADLTKTEVYAMARLLNNEIFRTEVIPSYLFPDELFRFTEEKILPSPELKKDQINPMKFGYHCALLEAVTDYKRKTMEDFIRWYLNGELHKRLGISIELMQRWGVDDPKVFTDDLEWFVSTVQKSIFKRIQTPPIVITSRSAYGYDIRESMLPVEFTRKYTELKNIVLKLERYPGS